MLLFTYFPRDGYGLFCCALFEFYYSATVQGLCDNYKGCDKNSVSVSQCLTWQHFVFSTSSVYTARTHSPKLHCEIHPKMYGLRTCFSPARPMSMWCLRAMLFVRRWMASFCLTVPAQLLIEATEQLPLYPEKIKALVIYLLLMPVRRSEFLKKITQTSSKCHSSYFSIQVEYCICIIHTRIDIYFGIFIPKRPTYPYWCFSTDGAKLQRGLVDSDMLGAWDQVYLHLEPSLWEFLTLCGG